ncbi:hypothetical protein M409DRAFT_23356 [Zasmidium cellare ATCC 36951]|uniref:Uncharacterized protein n=1 Tax=Zasmidium cellare ATCC 36951 TaxID=1080233 RepID=A0A6A6CG81_ZASCE|nr:uncharacterized protein M409DRAFT_23356 [Zasmidium cellare ATCC 36951]KAF2166165.1 hypothetical protein M409DRAFT_23356 [Zasmidium cellare ATCC 36951]
MAPWLRVLEAYMVQALLRTPAFHRAVEKVVRQVHRIRHGIPPEELGGTKIDQPGEPGFTRHFVQELKTQLGYAEQQEAKGVVKTGRGVDARQQKSTVVEEEGADGAWQTAQKTAREEPKKGFTGEYMDALREQVKNNKNG